MAVVLGLRHATDPDHLTAVAALIAGDQGGPGRARRLGSAWGLGHATTLFAFGLPIVVAKAYLPEPVQRGTELAIGVVIVLLALRLLTRRDLHGGRTPLQAYGIGLIHGAGGSAGVGVLLLAGIPDHVQAAAALALFAAFTAVSMTLASASFGWALSRPPVLRRFTTAAPVLGAASLAFGVWYSLGAL